jgi:hypothetical protein
MVVMQRPEIVRAVASATKTGILTFNSAMIQGFLQPPSLRGRISNPFPIFD